MSLTIEYAKPEVEYNFVDVNPCWWGDVAPPWHWQQQMRRLLAKSVDIFLKRFPGCLNICIYRGLQNNYKC